MEIIIPQNILSVLNTLKQNGFDAFLVGGCVRDMLLGLTPTDFDITTSATPSQIKNFFERTVDTGIKHGTVTVIVDKTPVEVTTFRTEGDYNDSRRPDNVCFVTDINQDLSRRDFTVNAIAYNPEMSFVDPFGGIEDIDSKVLKAVGNPKKRFTEDALRIMRLFRFASTLGFSIDKATEIAALECSDALKNISAERINSELKKTVSGKYLEFAKPLFDLNALSFLKLHKLENEKLITKLSNENLKFFAFIYFCSSSPQETLALLKASNKTKVYFKEVSFCLNNQPKTKADIKRLLNKLSDPQILFDATEFVAVTKSKNTDLITNTVREILKQKEPYKINHLCITGDDLKKQGFEGKEIKDKLDYLLEKVIENKELNQKNILLSL